MRKHITRHKCLNVSSYQHICCRILASRYWIRWPIIMHWREFCRHIYGWIPHNNISWFASAVWTVLHACFSTYAFFSTTRSCILVTFSEVIKPVRERWLYKSTPEKNYTQFCQIHCRILDSPSVIWKQTIFFKDHFDTLLRWSCTFNCSILL